MTLYAVWRKSNRDGSETMLARDIPTLAEAGELALRLIRLQEEELGGADQFYAQSE